MQNRQLNKETGKFDKEIEKILYEYPIWKVNLKHCSRLKNKQQAACDNRQNSLRLVQSNTEYQSKVDFVEDVIANLTYLEQEFIHCRYFKKMPFKIIAEKLAVVERHLYRIRRRVIDQFGLALGR